MTGRNSELWVSGFSGMGMMEQWNDGTVELGINGMAKN